MASTLENLYDCMINGTLGIVSAATEQFINQIGLTDNEKEILKKYSYKIFWCSVLEQYIESRIMLNFKEKLFLKNTTVETKDADLPDTDYSKFDYIKTAFEKYFNKQ